MMIKTNHSFTSEKCDTRQPLRASALCSARRLLLARLSLIGPHTLNDLPARSLAASSSTLRQRPGYSLAAARRPIAVSFIYLKRKAKTKLRPSLKSFLSHRHSDRTTHTYICVLITSERASFFHWRCTFLSRVVINCLHRATPLKISAHTVYVRVRGQCSRPYTAIQSAAQFASVTKMRVCGTHNRTGHRMLAALEPCAL